MAGLLGGPSGQRPSWAAALLLSLSVSFTFQKKIERDQKNQEKKAMEKNKIVGYFCKAVWNISNPTKVVPAKKAKLNPILFNLHQRSLNRV